MKKLALLFSLIGIVLMLDSCSEKCQNVYTYKTSVPVFMKKEELLKSVSSIPAKALKNTGKIWIYDKYLLVNELNKGVHVIDNSNPNFPRQVSFIQIPANVDMAVKGRVLYADSHTNLLAIDISNPLQIKILEVVENAFPPLYFHSDTTKGIIVDWEEKEITEIVDCNYQPCPNCFYYDRAFANSSGGKSATPSSNVSKGGSMARFTLNDDYLYTVNENSLKLFEITNPAKPKPTIDIPIGWGIETIFPYNDKLFIGSMTGMHIFDNSNPAKPEFVSTYSHVTSCDPVVVEGNYAYVTLRTEDRGTGLRRCVRGVNVLDVVDISNPKRPTLVKSYPMLNPHGVGIDKQNLFVCEGKHGLKYFRATDVQTIDKNLLNHLQGFDAYDVIPYDNLLIMVGKNGIYQFDYASKKELIFLSMLPVVQD